MWIYPEGVKNNEAPTKIGSLGNAMTVTDQAETEIITLGSPSEEDRFGFSVDINGTTAVIGTINDDTKADDGGAVYVYVEDGADWEQQAILTASDGQSDDRLGWQVAIDGNTLIAGALNNDEAAALAGAAYVFVRTGTTWTQQAKLTASDAGIDDSLGYSAAIKGDVAVVGAPYDNHTETDGGSAYVFGRTGTTWTQKAKLTGSTVIEGGWFGSTVAIYDGTIIVGETETLASSPGTGSAYVFTGSGTTWTQQAKLTASDGASNDRFGYSVALYQNTAIVGSRWDDDNGTNSGAAYVFVRTGTTWTQQAKLTASEGAAGDYMGSFVDVYKDIALVRSPFNGASALYVYSRQGTVWTENEIINASNGVSGDVLFGNGAIDGDRVVVGADLAEVNEVAYAGSAYIYDLDTPQISAPTDFSMLTWDTSSYGIFDFSWIADDATIAQWWIYAGTSSGSPNLYDKDLSTNTSAELTGLPTDGSTFYVTLWYRIGSSWYTHFYQYVSANTANISGPKFTGPVDPGKELPENSSNGTGVTLSWSANGTAGITEWEVFIGDSAGATDHLDSGSLGTSTSTTISNLPDDGRKLWFRLRYCTQVSCPSEPDWQYQDFVYTAFRERPEVTAPTPSSTLVSREPTFEWQENSVDVSGWQLYFGSSAGGTQHYVSSFLTGATTSLAIPNDELPNDNSTIYLRFWYRKGPSSDGEWAYIDYQFTACNGCS